MNLINYQISDDLIVNKDSIKMPASLPILPIKYHNCPDNGQD